MKAIITAGVGLLMLGTTGAFAEARIYPYNSSENFCPAGLQPTTISGTVCCAVPNQQVSYQSMMAHATPRKVVRKKVRKVYHRPAPARECPIGVKGCS